MEQAERRHGGKLKDIRDFIDDLYENGIHAKRVRIWWARDGKLLSPWTGPSSTAMGNRRWP
jgi:hypothetical protein